MASSHKDSERSKLGSFKQLKDGRIRVRVSHGYALDGSKRMATGYADNMADAERVAMQLSAELGRRPDLGRGLTLKKWWDAYTATKGQRITRATYSRYEIEMRRTWLPVMAKTDISHIERQDVQAVLLSLPTKSSAQHALRALSAVLTQAVRDGYLRATHETHMQQAGVLDSVNAAAHGHSERVSYSNYQRPDNMDAAMQAGSFLVLQGQKMHKTAV